MGWLFYFLSLLLFLWALLALATVIYSSWQANRRRARANLRIRLQEIIRTAAARAGRLELINAAELAGELSQTAGKDRECLRDCLIEQTQGLSSEDIRPLRETYEALKFVSEDIRALLRGRWHQRAQAALRLGHIHQAGAIEVLTGTLQDRDSDVRMAAVCALAEIGDPRSVSAIVYSLANADGWQVLQVADRLLHMPVDLTRPLLEMLQASGAVRERREAATKMVLELIADFGQRGCERLGFRAARNAAAQYLNHESIDMRARAIRAIAAVGIENNQELEQLVAKLSDKEWPVRAVAAKALGQLHLTEAVDVLTAALTDEAWWVRRNAAHALALLGPVGLKALYSQANNSDQFARDIAKQVIEELQLDAAVRA